MINYEDLNGKHVEKIWWNGANGDTFLSSKGQTTLRFESICQGDIRENWVVEYKDMVEVARHNCKYISSIYWIY